jgi:hypothetical protein
LDNACPSVRHLNSSRFIAPGVQRALLTRHLATMFTFHQRPKRGAFVIPFAGQFPISEAGLRRARAFPASSASPASLSRGARHAASMINHPRSPSRPTRERGLPRETKARREVGESEREGLAQNARINAADSPLIARVSPRRCFSLSLSLFFSCPPHRSRE